MAKVRYETRSVVDFPWWWFAALWLIFCGSLAAIPASARLAELNGTEVGAGRWLWLIPAVLALFGVMFLAGSRNQQRLATEFEDR